MYSAVACALAKALLRQLMHGAIQQPLKFGQFGLRPWRRRLHQCSRSSSSIESAV